MSRTSRTSSSDDHTGPPEPVSVVEDLDPDPPGSARRWRTREVVLGLVLLLGVLAWALGSWWQDESRRSHYEQGQQAAAERRWDDAFTGYSAAGGYKDAAALAQNALAQIQERDREYDAAVREQDGGPASLVLQAARAVQTIQPGYKDVDILAAQAEDQVYTGALSGTVVMRAQAQPPGLYYRGPGGWHYLQGSDAWSSVLSFPLSDAAQRYVVYDVPGPGWTAPTPTATDSPTQVQGIYEVQEGSPGKAGRRLVLATLREGAGELSFQNLRFDPAEYNMYVCSAAGVWGLRYGQTYGDSPVVKGGFDYLGRLDYEQISPTSTPTAVVLPGTDGMVVDFGHRSDMLLLAAYGPPVNDRTNTVLYATRGDGSRPRVVYWTTGTLVSATLSPDDRYALVVVAGARQDVAGKVTVSALLLPLDSAATGAPAPPVTLQEISIDGINTLAGVGFALKGQLSISGIFLEKGAFENKLLLAWYDGHAQRAPATGVRIRLIDVRDPGRTLSETTVDYADQALLPVAEQDDGRTLLIFDEGGGTSTGADKPPSVDLRMLRVETRTDGATETSTVMANIFELPLSQSDAGNGNIGYLSGPTLRGDNLIYRTEQYDSARGEMSYSAYNVPLATAQDPGGAGIQPVQIYKAIAPPEPPGGQNTARGGVAGPGAFAYADAQGTLHALSYGAITDVPLENGVGAIVELKANTFYKALR